MILGDEGYGIAPFLMVPYSNPTTNAHVIFNKAHKENRIVIEQTFGQWKRRFPILRYGIRLKLERAPSCVVACAVLHNIVKYLGDDDNFEEFENIDEDMVLLFNNNGDFNERLETHRTSST